MNYILQPAIAQPIPICIGSIAQSNMLDYQSLAYLYSTKEAQCEKLKVENLELRTELEELRARHHYHQKKLQKGKIKRKRRSIRELKLQFRCPYDDCERQYASELALNLHIRNKHNGGSKTQRQNLAKLIALAEEKGGVMPEINICFPPGFIEDFKKDFFGNV